MPKVKECTCPNVEGWINGQTLKQHKLDCPDYRRLPDMRESARTALRICLGRELGCGKKFVPTQLHAHHISGPSDRRAPMTSAFEDHINILDLWMQFKVTEHGKLLIAKERGASWGLLARSRGLSKYELLLLHSDATNAWVHLYTNAQLDTQFSLST